MKHIRLIIALVTLCVPALHAQNANHDWDLSIDTQTHRLSISHTALGVIVRHLQLGFMRNDGFAALSGLTVEDKGETLSVITKEPVSTAWEFRKHQNSIDITSSAKDAAIRGIVPAPASRIPARFADPGKMQDALSDEQTDYTGAKLRERFYVPSDAAHVMYLALGMVEARNLHALFDRRTDILIRFPGAGQLHRNDKDETQMDLVVPIKTTTTFLSLTPEYYTKVLGMPKYIPYDDTYHTTAPTGWNHWLAFYRQVTEQDIVNAADWISDNLEPYGMLHCQLDDGYDHTDHRHWVKDWDPKTFPHGPKWLAHYIKSKGLIPGLWTVPYSYCTTHGDPKWFLRDASGKIVMDYQGGGELDFSKPEVIQKYWIPLFRELKSQGWEYYKFDMGSAVERWVQYQDRFYDKTKTPYDISRETMRIFREIMGPEVWHTNHPDNWGGRMGVLDVAGCGRDPGPGWTRMNNFFEVISNNTYQNHMVWYSDPDCIVLRGKPTRADRSQRHHDFLGFEEARTAASLLTITGLQFLSGDDLPNLEPQRVDLIKGTIPILPILPIDLFGRGRDPKHYPQIFDLKVNQPSGVYDVIAVTNWRNDQITRTVSFEKDLALSSKDTYLVFDFWGQKLIGTFSNGFRTVLPAHGTRVFTIRRSLDRPQILATNRHLTGAFSIKRQQWDPSTLTLSGTSAVVPGSDYRFFLHVPGGTILQSASADAADISYQAEPAGIVRVSVAGRKDLVNWKLTFHREGM